MTTLPLAKPVDPVTVEISRHLDVACKQLGIDFLIVGATARIILLEHVLGIAPGRATRDVDFAVAVDSWDSFEKLRQALTTTGRFTPSEKAEQRLLFFPPSVTNPLPPAESLSAPSSPFLVDLIPFGELENPPHTISWPPDLAITMNVIGYAEALESATIVQLDTSLAVRIASLPGQAVLKLLAWKDRGPETQGKDARDFNALAESYFDTGNQERIYSQSEEVGNALEWDPTMMGAQLLGSDAAALARPDTRDALTAILDTTATQESLLFDMARGQPSQESSLERARALLAAFTAGFRS
jgi:predicted nucleotidyltransferase